MVFAIRRWPCLLLVALLPACQPRLLTGSLPAMPSLRESQPRTTFHQPLVLTMPLRQAKANAPVAARPATKRGQSASLPRSARRMVRRRGPSHLFLSASPVSLPLISQPAPEPPKNTAFLNAGLLLAVGGVLLLAAGIMLAISLSGWAALGTLLGGIAGSGIALMAAVFSATAHNSETKSRFNLLKLAGILTLPGGVALALSVGGLLGVGLGTLVVAVGALLIGIGIMAGVPDAPTPPRG